MDVTALLGSKGSRVATTRPDAKISEAAHKLKHERIGALVVSEDDVAVAGIISERDIVRGLAEHGGAVLERKVESLMTREVVTCAPGDRIAALMAQMTERRIRHLPVVEDGRLCGMISIGDVVKHRLEEIESEADALRQYIATA
jgi:CBS domain-containing protein